MTVVVGGGWAGIAAAVELARRGRPVTLIEAADRLGGRARTISYRGRQLDNGQHLLLGACHELLQLQQTLGLAGQDLYVRRPLELRMLSRDLPALQLRLPALPAPWHLIAALLSARGLAFGDRLRALRLCLAIARLRLDDDCSVARLLADQGQPARLVEQLWQPLCLAIMNTPPEAASARIFTRVLRDAFMSRRGDSDLLLARCGLGALLPEPARAYIEARGGRVLCGRRVVGLEVDDQVVTAVRLGAGAGLAVDDLILAVPPRAAAALLEGHAATAALATRLGQAGSHPICTVYLEYAPATALPFPLVGLHGTTAQWVYDLAVCGHPGLMSVVISGPGAHMAIDNEQLAARISSELAGFFPHWPAPRAVSVIREKRATFISAIGIDEIRPGVDTGLANCRIAGDFVATGYPATLEGAVRSGLAAARSLLGEA